MRHNNSAAPPPPTGQVSKEHFCPGPLHVAEAHLSNPSCLLHSDVLPNCRLAPVSADPAETTADHLHASDHTRSNRVSLPRSRLLRQGSRPGDFLYGLEHCSHFPHLVELTSSTSSPIYPRHRQPSGGSRRPPLQGMVSPPLANVGAPAAPFSRIPLPEPSRLYQATNGTSRSAFQFIHQRTRVNDDFSRFTNHNEFTLYHS